MRIRDGQPQQIGGAAQYRARALEARGPREAGTGPSVSVDRTRVSEEARDLSATKAQFDDTKVERLRDTRLHGGLVAEPAVIAARIMQED